jgi:hypothetical protein
MCLQFGQNQSNNNQGLNKNGKCELRDRAGPPVLHRECELGHIAGPPVLHRYALNGEKPGAFHVVNYSCTILKLCTRKRCMAILAPRPSYPRNPHTMTLNWRQRRSIRSWEQINVLLLLDSNPGPSRP